MRATQEGTRSNNPAIFMIQTGLATVSVTVQLPDGAGGMEADVTDLKPPDYFGEGTVSLKSD
jgi:hypothetical protein